MAVTYPSTLPQAPQRSNYTRAQANNVISSKMDIGENKKRRRYTQPIYNEKWSMLLNETQLPIFTSWFEDDLSSGVLRFTFTDIVTGTTEDFRIKEMYNLAPYGSCGAYKVSFDVERSLRVKQKGQFAHACLVVVPDTILVFYPSNLSIIALLVGYHV